MFRGSSIELNALGESWRCRKCQKIGYCMFGSRQGIPGCDRVREMQRTDYCWFWVTIGNSWSRQSSFWFCVAIGIPVSRHGSHILSNKSCCNMAFFVATGVLVLCRDDVATETTKAKG